jgi:ribosomal protein S18 acetylase RimI-like enzyme
MEIRTLGVGDDEIVFQAAHLFDETPLPSAVRRFLAEPGHHLLIAFADETAVGFVSGVELTHPDKGTEMFLYELAVDERHRRRGVGTALAEALRDLARARGCYDMWVLTDEDNEAALGTYRKSGSTDSSTHVMLTWPLSGASPARSRAWRPARR